jgi:hypothetical protein
MITGHHNRFSRPVSIYANWAAYDELSDNIRLTEELTLKQFHEMLRLREHGVRFDYYLIDAFWFAREGGYRQWRKPDWSDHGPQKFLGLCHEHNIKPGIWVSTNFRVAADDYWFLDVIPEWQDSLATHGRSFCLFHGGYLNHFMKSLQMLADQGFKMIKFDFADFSAATSDIEKTHTAKEIRENNINAFISAMKIFRFNNPDVLTLAYNGFDGEYSNTATPLTRNISLRWLEIFDSLYCGDPRLSDTPFSNFWRSKDHYTDHMVRQYEFNGIPLKNIDNCGFMIGHTGTCYHRGKSGWKAALVLSLVRGGWMNVYYGDLSLLDNKDADWFGKAQALLFSFQKYGQIGTLGSIPGTAKPYGYIASDREGAVLTMVNPEMEVKEILLNDLTDCLFESSDILFADQGFEPAIRNNILRIGPEQMVVVGYGEYADRKYNLGHGEYNRIAAEIISENFHIKNDLGNSMEAEVLVREDFDLLVTIQQFEKKSGLPLRSSGGGEPHGTRMNEIFKLTVSQQGKTIPFQQPYDKAIWSGLSWVSAKIESRYIEPGEPIKIQFSTKERTETLLELKTYLLKYRY